jgi:DNA primase
LIFLITKLNKLYEVKMAKISPVSIKYMIYAKFDAIGPVEKPDVIGAIFGQTEGLLGSELEIRQLQKEGKIGRIEVEVEANKGRTKGTIQIPTALDQSETSLIGAAIETIDRVGPTEAEIRIEKIEDVRGSKRDYILERAKKLLGEMSGSNSSKEMSHNLMISTRASKIQEYGEEKLPSGDLSENQIIVVEGRADVVNLLENHINNVIGMNGTKIPKGVIELSKEKEITLFADGDRGGKLIAKNVIENANVKYVAFAPDGKEVEELSGKEILASLRKKIPAEEFISSVSDNFKDKEKSKISKEEFKKKLKEVDGTKQAYFYNENLEAVKKVSASKAGVSLKKAYNIEAIAIDGKATKTVVKLAEEKSIKFIAAHNFEETVDGIEFISF